MPDYYRFLFTGLATHCSDGYNAFIPYRRVRMACPFFMPTQKSEEGAWIHPSRLPLGAGWVGLCSAPGHEGTLPESSEIHEFCNMGYASTCHRLPVQRACDAVRFGIAHDRGQQVSIWFICETQHRPGEYGKLEYDGQRGGWAHSHADARIQKMAECYLESYLQRRPKPSQTGSSVNS